MPECAPIVFFDQSFDVREFNIALENKNIKLAPGLDGIDYEIIKKLPFNYKLIYNEQTTFIMKCLLITAFQKAGSILSFI